MQSTRPFLERAARPRLLTNADRVHLFGDFAFEPAGIPDNPEKIKVTDDWKGRNLIEVGLGPLIPAQGADVGLFHIDVAPHFETLIEAWGVAGLADRVLTWNGSYAARFKRGRAPTARELPTLKHADLVNRLSAHAWGTAFDINAARNRLGSHPARIGSTGSVLELVPIAEKLGWVWGGRWRTPDGMHFEWAGAPKGVQ